MNIRGRIAAVGIALVLLILTVVIGLAPRAIPHALYLTLSRIDVWMSDCPKPNVSRFITAPDATKKTKLVVFVHGIFGDPICTWTAKADSQSFFKAIRADTHIAATFDIFSFGYPTGIFDEFALTPEQAGAQLAAWLRDKPNYSEIVFVTHSMGALAALEAITTSPDVADRTSMVLALSPPFDGSELARQGDKVWLPNPALRLLFPPDSGDAYLARLAKKVAPVRARYKEVAKRLSEENSAKLIPEPQHRMIPELSLHCAAENRPSVLGTLAVPTIKSDLCSTLRTLNRTHQDISVPRGVNPIEQLQDDPVAFVVGYLRRRTGPNPGVTVTALREADYSQATCTGGRRRYVENLTDTFRLSSIPHDRIFLRAGVRAGMQVSVIDLAASDSGSVVQPLGLRGAKEDLCTDPKRCEKLLTFDGLKASGTDLKYRWEWRSDSLPVDIDGVILTSDYPITSFIVDVVLPPDATAHPRANYDRDKTSRGLSCRVPIGPTSGRIRYICTPVDPSRPLWGPLALYFGDTVEVPPCH